MTRRGCPIPAAAARALRGAACAAAVLLLAHCGQGPAEVAGGGGVETTGGELVGASGAAAGARVRLVPEGWRPVPGAAFPDSLTATADSAGRYGFDSVAPGFYNLEAHLPADGTRLFRGGVRIAAGKNALGRDSLRPAGSLRLHWSAARKGILYLPGTTVALSVGDAESQPPDILLDSLPAGRLPGVRHRAQAADTASSPLTDSLTILPGGTARAEVLAGWAHSGRVRINTSSAGADVPVAVSDFPLLVRLYQGDLDFAQAARDGRDLRATGPDGALLPLAIDRWDSAAGQAVIWIRVPRVEGGSDSASVTLHWGNPAAARYSPGPVFDGAGGYSAVWHLDEPGNTSPGGYADALGRHPGTAPSLIDNTVTEGLIAGCLALDGSKHVAVGGGPALDSLEQITLSAWFKAALWTGGDRTLVQKGVVAGQYGLVDATDSDSLEFRLPVAGVNRAVRIAAPSIGELHLVHATFDGNLARVYLDGVLKRTEVLPGAMGVSNDSLYIGHRPGGLDSDHFQGLLDEVTVSRVARSPHWIKLAYETQKHLSKVVELEILR